MFLRKFLQAFIILSFCYSANTFAQTAKTATTATTINPEAKKLYEAGLVLFDAKDYTSAVAKFTQALDISPKYEDCWAQRGLCFLRLKEFQKGINDYNSLLSFAKGYASDYYNRGLCYELLKQYEKASIDYSQAILLAPTEGRYYGARYYAYCSIGNTQKAKIDKESANKYGYSNLGDCSTVTNTTYTSAYDAALDLYDAGKYKEAIIAYNKLIEKFPTAAPPYVSRGVAYEKDGQMEMALKDYLKATILDPYYQIAFENAGIYYFKKSSDKEAKEYFLKAHQLMVTNNSSFFLGRLSNFEEKYSDAIEYFDQALNLNSIDYESLFHKAFAQGNLEMYEEAIATLDQHMELDTKSSDAYYNRSLYKYILKKDEEALKDVQKAIEIDAAVGLYYGLRAKIYCVLGKKKEAKADEEKAISMGEKIENLCE